MSAPESTTFNYVISLLPQLITIIVAIMAGFKALQMQNEKKITEAKNNVLSIIENEKQDLNKDMKEIYKSLESLNGQYRIITDFIKQEIARHERMLERLDTKNVGRYGDASDIEHR